MQACIHDEDVACAEVRYSIAESVTERMKCLSWYPDAHSEAQNSRNEAQQDFHISSPFVVFLVQSGV